MTAFTQQQGSINQELVETVYSIISENDGKLVASEVQMKVGLDKKRLYRALQVLSSSKRIKRVKAFGKTGIIYLYCTIH